MMTPKPTEAAPVRFSPRELEFLASQALGRLAYLGADGSPIVVPVGYRVIGGDDEGHALAIVGHELESSAKYRALARDPRCSFVVDAGIGPEARGLLVRGLARRADGPGRPALIIDARRITTWGIESPAFERLHRRLGAATGGG